ncbi:Rho GTPase activating protein [Fusarium falciforme]|nr:Rho GTPase activating protein [Fusarium falciforme]
MSPAHDARHDAVDNNGDGADTPDAPTGLTPQQQQHHDTDPDGGDAKRPRACEACRGLKVRCEPDPNDEGPCKRCRKAGRSCVVTMPTRKRQKKTDSRVAELEKKIDALTASLQARAAPPGGHGHGVGGFADRTIQARSCYRRDPGIFLQYRLEEPQPVPRLGVTYTIT